MPLELEGRLAPGQRVRVPFRGRPRPAVVVAIEPGPGAELETLTAALDPVPALSPALVELGRWVATETVSAWGEVLFRALPPGVRAGAPPVLPGDVPAPAGPGGVALAGGRDRRAQVEARVAAALDAGAGALVLAPEIEQARAWAGWLEARLGQPVTLLTSAASAGQRWAAWWALRQGQGRVAVGTRGAAWAPVPRLGLAVVLDEEDPAHKASDAPRWHAREVVVERARRDGQAVLLTSAAPSLETYARVREGSVTVVPVPAAARPTVERVALDPAGAASDCLSRGLRAAVHVALARPGAVLLVLNRLGFARGLACAECGLVRRCARCRVPLGFHREARALACRLCGMRVPAASLCGRCRGRRLQPLGWGTERVEAEAREAFPEARVVRYDSTLPPGEAAAAREAVRSGAARVVVGTHMALRLAAATPVAVGALLLADATLNVPDFRAAERTFQLAWRLAESVHPEGSVWLQSFRPDHPALEAVAVGDPERFYGPEWAERQELGYPPARRMARLVLEGREAERLAAVLADRGQGVGLTVLGPAALAGTRTQVVFLGGPELPEAVARALEPFRGRRRLGATRLAVDIDPVDLP